MTGWSTKVLSLQELVWATDSDHVHILSDIFLTVSGDQWRGTWMLQQYLNLSYLLNSYNSILVSRKCHTFPHQVLLFWFLIILPDLHFTRFWCIFRNRKWNAYKFSSGGRIIIFLRQRLMASLKDLLLICSMQGDSGNKKLLKSCLKF